MTMPRLRSSPSRPAPFFGHKMVGWGTIPLLTVALLTAPASFGARAEPLTGSLDATARQQIQGLFAAAQTSLGAENGAAVLALLSRTSRSRIEAVHAAARSTLPPQNTLGPAEKLAVRTLQRFVPTPQLRRLRVPDLVSRALAQHWLSPATLRAASLGTIKVDGTHASAPLVIDGKPALVRAEFVRDSGRWQIDLTPTVTEADALLRVFAGLSGQNEDRYIEKLVSHLRPPPANPNDHHTAPGAERALR